MAFVIVTGFWVLVSFSIGFRLRATVAISTGRRGEPGRTISSGHDSVLDGDLRACVRD